MKKTLQVVNIVIILVPLLVLAGWQFDIEIFKRPIPSSVEMNPVSALAILFSGLALMLFRNSSDNRNYKTAAQILAFLVMSTGVIKLAALFTIFDLGIDRILFTHKLWTDRSNSTPNSMAPNAAFDFMLYGLALILVWAKNMRARKTANYLSLVTLLVGLFSVIGYLYHVRAYYDLFSFYPMAIHTAICFILLSLLMLSYNNEVGFMIILSSPNIAGQVARLLIPATIVIPMALGFIRLYAQWHIPISVEFGVSLLIISIITFFFSLTWYVAFALNKADLARLNAETELKQKNEDLQAAEERLQLATKGASAGLWDWVDMNADEEWWSSGFYQLLGYENNEIPASAKTFREMMHADDFKRIAKGLEAHFKNESKFEVEARLKTKNGNYKWYLGTGQVIRNQSGAPVRMVGSIIDIDEQKRTRDYIEQQAALINMLPDGIVFYSKGMKFADINAGAEKMFDLKREDIVGKNLNEFISFTLVSGEKFEDSLARLWQTGFYRDEIEITNRKSGKTTQVLVSIKKMENAYQGEPLFMAIYTDLTPLRVNEELKKALKSVESHNQYLEQFAYISAHDIKAPIITVSGLIELLAKRNAVKTEHIAILEMLTSSINQIQRTNHALNDILKLRKNLLSKEFVSGQSMPLKTIIEDALLALKGETENIDATIETDLTDLADINFSYIYLKSIFYNLLSNSLKYKDPNRPLLIKLTAIKTENDIFRFIIEDNGLGFELDRNKSKLFGIFKRFHTHVEGTGVGLHIVKSIVDDYNGRIDVQSKPGVGTCFVIDFNKNILA